jgi:hypothetical protein
LINEWQNGSLERIINVATPGSGYAVTGLMPDIPYRFQVQSYNSSGYSWSNSVSTLTLPAAPIFTLTAVSPTTINVSWNTVPGGASNYVVDEWVNFLSMEQLATLPSTSSGYSITGLTPGTSYTFLVGASNASGTTWAYYQSVATLPSAPTFTLAQLSNNNVNLSWGSVAGATGYVIDEYINGAWEPVATVSSGTTSYAVLGVVPNASYEFMVGASDSSGTTWSTAQTITIRTLPPRVSVPG